MLPTIPEDRFVEALKSGVDRTRNLLARLTDYHGGAVKTEYLLTADVAREFIERDYEVRVECKNRELIGGYIGAPGVNVRKILKGKRTDVAIVSSLYPLAMIELKIRVTNLRHIVGDLNKLTATMACLKPEPARNVIGASVFEVHASDPRHYTEAQYLKAAQRIEKRIDDQLKTYALTKPDYEFKWVALQADTAGITPREIEFDEGGGTWGQDGHATRYHAILVRSLAKPTATRLPFQRPPAS
jgi:hypothetical protein